MALKRTPLAKGNSTLKRNQVPIQSKSKLSKGKELRAKPKSAEEIQKDQDQRNRDREFYTKIYQERGPYSEVSGIWIGNEVLSIHYHHIIPKAQWPIGRYIDINIIILTGDEHATVESNPNKYPVINKRRDQIKELYNL